jgi:hemerythrin
MSAIPVKTLERCPEDALGVAEIDRAHEVAFGILHRLQAAMLVGKGKDVLPAVLAEMRQFAFDLIAQEEELMAGVQYPELRAHVAQHDELRRNVGGFAKRFASGELTMTIELTLFLAEWLQHHFTIDDRRLAGYLNTRGSNQLD